MRAPRFYGKAEAGAAESLRDCHPALERSARVRRASGTQARVIDALRTPAARREAELLARLRRGDSAAFTELVQQNEPRMLATARRMLRGDEDARDAVQQAWLCALRALPRFAGESSLSTWLHRIALNAALMRLRTRRRHPEDTLEDWTPIAEGSASCADAGASEDCTLERAELSAHVRDAVSRLPQLQRTIIELRDLDGLDTEEAARRLSISREAVKTRLHRARRALRVLLEREGLAAHA